MLKDLAERVFGLQEDAGDGEFTERGVMISTYVLCGFANIGSIAILIGGLRSAASDRSSGIALLGLKALLAGLMATLTTACFAGMLGG